MAVIIILKNIVVNGNFWIFRFEIPDGLNIFVTKR